MQAAALQNSTVPAPIVAAKSAADSTAPLHNSTFSTLPPAQAAVAAALAQGASIIKAAAAAGVHRSTVHLWIKNQAAFRAAVDEARSEYVDLLSDTLRDLSVLALATLRSLLEDPKTPPSVRLKTALEVLKHAYFPPDAHWALPRPVCVPLRQLAQDRAEREAAVEHPEPVPDAVPQRLTPVCAVPRIAVSSSN